MKVRIIKTGIEIEIEILKSRVSNNPYLMDKWGNQYKPEDLEMAESTCINGTYIEEGYKLENLFKI